MIKKLTDLSLEDLFQLEKNIFSNEAYSKNQIHEELTLSNRLYLGYYENNQLIGYLGFMKSLDVADVIKIGVDKNFRKQGVAKKLLINGINTLKTLNIKEIMLEVNTENEPAILLYKSLGFVLISTRKNYYKNNDAQIYKLTI